MIAFNSFKMTTLDEPWAALVVVVLTLSRLHIGDDRLHAGYVPVAVGDNDYVPVVAVARPPIAWKTIRAEESSSLTLGILINHVM